MKRTIPAGKHRPWPPMLPKIWYDKRAIGRRVIFTESCLYDLPGTEHDQDINKLFGIGFFPGHHQNSARFGWYYDAKTFHLSLFSYCYLNGERITNCIGAACIGAPYDFLLKIKDGHYFFQVKEATTGLVVATDEVAMGHQKKWAYPLGLYFGGSQVSPHKMTFHISKIKV